VQTDARFHCRIAAEELRAFRATTEPAPQGRSKLAHLYSACLARLDDTCPADLAKVQPTLRKSVNMREQRTIGWEVVCVLLLASCGQVKNDANDTVTAKLPHPTAVAEDGEKHASTAEPLLNEAASENQPAAEDSMASAKPVELPQAVRSRYTSLEPASCKPLGALLPNGSSSRWRCTGPAGYALETSATDPQQFAIIGPDGIRTQLDLSVIASDGTLGKLAEWRGDPTGRPRALIVRVSGARRAEISSLVVAKVDAAPCIVSVIARGPGQNEKARTVADRKQLTCSAR
jgi:hypothetical protein